MNATVKGMLVEVGSTDRKDQYGRPYEEPFVVLYSGGEAVKIAGIRQVKSECLRALVEYISPVEHLCVHSTGSYFHQLVFGF